MGQERINLKKQLQSLSQKIKTLKNEYEETLYYGREWHDNLIAPLSMATYRGSFFNTHNQDDNEVMKIIKLREGLRVKIADLENEFQLLKSQLHQKTTFIQRVRQLF